MATTDANGIVQFTGTDSISNLPATLNTLGSSVSSAITDVRDDLIYKASSATDATSKKNALAAAGIVGTTANPLIFFRTDTGIIYTWDGSAWAARTITSSSFAGNIQAGKAALPSPDMSIKYVPVTFTEAFASTPMVMSRTLILANNTVVWTSPVSITTTSFQIRYKASKDSGYTSTDVDWIAFGKSAA